MRLPFQGARPRPVRAAPVAHLPLLGARAVHCRHALRHAAHSVLHAGAVARVSVSGHGDEREP